MTETDNDKLLRDFFAENKREIEDNGFSRRVMKRLPHRSERAARLWSALVLVVSTGLFVGLGGLQAIWNTLREVFVSMVEQGTAELDPQSIIIVAIVLVVLGTQKVASLA